MSRIAEGEAHARRYHPVYTMHKRWARRLGRGAFRTISLYTLTDEEPGATARPVTAQQEVVEKPPASTAQVAFFYCQME